MVISGRAAGLLLGACAAVFAAAGCIEKLSGPACIEKPWTIASTSADTITTSTGLRFVNGDSGVGNGAEWCGTVAVHYTGYLLDSTKFDSSRDLGFPLVFSPGVGALIDGFEQGVIGMRVCGTRRLIIPPNLGWDSLPVQNDSGDVIVPPNSTIVFDVEILEIRGEPTVGCDTLGA